MKLEALAFDTGGTAPDWPALVRSGLTLVIDMGIARVTEIAQALREAGMAADMPAAVVSAACTPQQRHALCRLDTLAHTVREAALPSPAVLVIGRVVQAAALPAVAPWALDCQAT